MSAEPSIIAPDPFLGTPLRHYPSDRLKPLLVAGIIGAPIALLLALTAASVEAWWGMPVTVGGMAITGLALGWYVLHLWNREIILYQRGFSFREGSRTIYFAYPEIKWLGLQAQRLAYFGGLVHRDVYRIDVWTYAGDHILITNLYRRVSDLGTRLTEQVNRVLRPELERKFLIGEPVEFGESLALTRDGFSVDGQQLLWEEYGGHQIGQGKLRILKRNGEVFHEVPLSMIYNVTLFIDMLRQNRPDAQDAVDHA